ncbi:MAG: hypothetical protein ACON4N_17525 [Myxococcota bacterium]
MSEVDALERIQTLTFASQGWATASQWDALARMVASLAEERCERVRLVLQPGDSGPCPSREAMETRTRVLRSLETSGVRVALDVAGEVRGDRLALALSCHVLSDAGDATLTVDPDARERPPVPGTLVRLAWLVGLDAALGMLFEGRDVRLADMDTAGGGSATRPWDMKGARPVDGGLPSPRGDQLLAIHAARRLADRGGAHPLDLSLLTSLYDGLRLTFDEAVTVEEREWRNLTS